MSSEPVGSECVNCGKGEVAHLQGTPKDRNGKNCPGYRPKGGITKEQGLALIRAAADSAEKRAKRKPGRSPKRRRSRKSASGTIDHSVMHITPFGLIDIGS